MPAKAYKNGHARDHFIFIALHPSLFYNNSMIRLYLLIAVAFLGILGLGIFFGFLAGIDRAKFSDPTREEQKNMATATWKEQKKLMDDFQYQNQKYKQRLPKYPTTKF